MCQTQTFTLNSQQKISKLSEFDKNKSKKTPRLAYPSESRRHIFHLSRQRFVAFRSDGMCVPIQCSVYNVVCLCLYIYLSHSGAFYYIEFHFGKLSQKHSTE